MKNINDPNIRLSHQAKHLFVSSSMELRRLVPSRVWYFIIMYITEVQVLNFKDTHKMCSPFCVTC